MKNINESLKSSTLQEREVACSAAKATVRHLFHTLLKGKKLPLPKKETKEVLNKSWDFFLNYLELEGIIADEQFLTLYETYYDSYFQLEMFTREVVENAKI